MAQQQLFSLRDYAAPRYVSRMNYAQVGQPFVSLTPETFEMLEDMALWAANLPKKLAQYDDILASVLAMLAGSFAQKYSAGWHRRPEDTARAWAMPVPRITERYFLSWRIQRLARGTWMLTNDSREAFYIEYGIHRNPVTGQVAARRIRRPIFKLTLLRTMEYVQGTAIGHRVWSNIVIPGPGQPGRRTRLVKWSQPSGKMGTHDVIVGVTPYGLLKSYGT